MNNQIDLSKAYTGQYITLANGKRYRIGDITKSAFQCSIWSFCNELSAFYKFNGKICNGDGEFDIVSIEDSPEIKLLKNYAQIEALEWALKYISAPFERGRLCANIDDLKAEIVLLIAETHESN